MASDKKRKMLDHPSVASAIKLKFRIFSDLLSHQVGSVIHQK